LVRIYGQDCESIIETIDSPKMFSFVQINKALLFVLATWSARSIQAFQALTTALKARDRNIQILVVNIDDLKESDVLKQIEDVCEGKGEVFWISNGKILHSAVLSTDEKLSAAIEYTNQFVKRGK